MPIHVLDPQVAAKIAAGEVVERPVSAVKELIENALDAGASRIVVEIVNGGLDTIVVLDDGAGIAAGEVELAFRRFATSKVADLSDLEAISTLGFRGEALASIAAVASVTLVTKTSKAETATEFRITEGKAIGSAPIGAAGGTSVTVRGLFSSFPARLKFLSSALAEASRVRTLIQRYSLAYPAVAWSLTVNGRRSVGTSGAGSLVDAVVEIYDSALAAAMLPVFSEDDSGTAPGSIGVTGLTGAPTISRSTRTGVNIFINGRWVQAGRLGHAVEQAYHGFLGERRFPITVLNVAIDPAELDVNVHPAKTEVRFLRGREVYAAVQRAVREALLRHSPVPNIEGAFGSGGVDARTGAMWTSGLARSESPSEHAAAAADLSHDPETTPSRVLPALRVLGQSQTTYIVAEGPDGLYLVDQHAAHERVLYERVVAESGAGASQALLVPAQVDLSELEPEIGEMLVTSQDLLIESGFQLEAFGPSVYRLRSVPAAMGTDDPVGGLIEVVGAMADADRGQSDRLEYAARSIACHGAVRAGKRMAREEMEELTRLLEGCAQPHTCPHGRPTIIHLSEGRLEREFGRA